VRYEDLRDLIVPSEFHHRFGDFAAAKDARFDLQAPREPKRLSL
jgi:hypothetical protein